MDEQYAKPVLVTTQWVAEHVEDENVVVAEVDEDPTLYDEGHVPGAINLHWRDDLQDPTRRDVVDRDAFGALMERRGISNDTTVIVYGDKNNWFAAYAYWYMKLYGHENVRVMDGGRALWISEGRDLSVEPPVIMPAVYKPAEQDEAIRARRDQVMSWIDPDTGTWVQGLRVDRALVDVRSPQEYSGELMAPPGYEQEGASRSGHIPTAQSIPWAQAVRDDGTFKDVPNLRALYEDKGVTPDKGVTVYCRIGERSAHTWFVLHELLGYEDVRNYDGSWTEWGNLIDVPIER